jgi:16S rRNA (cytosine967-C5)-methyltransferase
MVMDVTQHKHQTQYDLIIADVPCSGSGTWARTPEQLYFFKKERIKYYSDLQKAITGAVASSIRSGGHLLYITCSVFAEENEKVVAHLEDNYQLRTVAASLFKGYSDNADTLFAALLTSRSFL